MAKLSEIVKYHRRLRNARQVLSQIDKATGIEVELEVPESENLLWGPSIALTKPDHITAVLGFAKLEAEAAVVESEAWLIAAGIEIDPPSMEAED